MLKLFMSYVVDLNVHSVKKADVDVRGPPLRS